LNGRLKILPEKAIAAINDQIKKKKERKKEKVERKRK
jgi:hypothetical protein